MHVYPITSLEELRQKDFAQILSLLSLPEDGPCTPAYEDLAYTLAYNGVLFVARDKPWSTILGVATLCLTFTLRSREAIVMHIDVPPEHRGIKVGIHLLLAMEQHARKNRVQLLRLLHPSEDILAEKGFRDLQFVRVATTGLHEKLL